MINKKSSTAFQFIFGGILLVSAATIGCNDSSTTTETKTDTITTEKMKEETPAPVVMDTMHKMDTAGTRPIVPTNKPANP
ncbi:MAG: hypothetical protein ABI741_12050 [Ferruginibacter sp.]